MAEVLDPKPPQWITFSDDAGRPLASIRSRASVEWSLRREGRTLNADQREYVIQRDGNVCGLCGGDVAPEDIHIDHIWPRSLGGSNHPDNLQVAHSSCNMSKGNRI